MTANLPFVMFRKKDKLPRKRIGEEYSLEYGDAQLDIHADALARGQRCRVDRGDGLMLTIRAE
jgi:adenine/guanine phosphoribosyltransferase-like PRPP-binding protein